MYVLVSSAVSSLRSDGNDDSLVAELELSHVLHRGNRPFNACRPIRRGMLGAGVLGNDLAGGPRDGEGTAERAHGGAG